MDQVSDPMRNHPCLAASGAGKHQERAFNVLYRFTLRVGQAFQKRIQGILSQRVEAGLKRLRIWF